MSTYRPDLDVASARKIARGQISLVVQETAERIANLPAKYPAKRDAWVRFVEKEFKEAYKETLLAVASQKRRVLAIYLLPLAQQYDGWVAIEASIVTFGKAMRFFPLAAISESAIIRLMQGIRACRPIDALKEESLDWFIPSIMAGIASPDRSEILCIPTKWGYFTAKWDYRHNAYVYTSWQPDRLLTDRDRAVLCKLRCEERLGTAAELGDCVERPLACADRVDGNSHRRIEK